MPRACWIPIFVGLLALTLGTGCNGSTGRFDPDNPDLADAIQLVMPRELRVEGFTKPVSFIGDGSADGLEAVVKTLDYGGDPVKSVGTFNFELYTMRMASGDRLGERLAVWSVPVHTRDQLESFWDRFARFYRFSLRIDGARLKAGRYIINAWLVLPNGERIFDTGQFEFNYEGQEVPPALAAR